MNQTLLIHPHWLDAEPGESRHSEEGLTVQIQPCAIRIFRMRTARGRSSLNICSSPQLFQLGMVRKSRPHAQAAFGVGRGSFAGLSREVRGGKGPRIVAPAGDGAIATSRLR